MSSIECQLAQGCVGDLIVIRGKDEEGETIPVRLTSDVVTRARQAAALEEGGQADGLHRTGSSGGRSTTRTSRSCSTRAARTTSRARWASGPGSSASATGSRITVRVNGTTVNECYDVFPAAGKILLQSEGFELFVRKFELHPLEEMREGSAMRHGSLLRVGIFSRRRPPRRDDGRALECARRRQRRAAGRPDRLRRPRHRRGRAGALAADPNVKLVAMGDAFEDRLQKSLAILQKDEKVAGKIDVKPEHCFVGFDAYQDVLE